MSRLAQRAQMCSDPEWLPYKQAAAEVAASPTLTTASQVCFMQADMFSFAVVLWTICTQEVPIRGHLRTLRVSLSALP